ncbi:hypothetical protein STCU_04273 [Strigomonas culicis]|uniref:Uncharacterized protein n=1 Tax=Strigomonas culicis TaxID=28005 RepID=S9VSB9_9TRYP|nr:hypothetical protein STCU_04273 [Strigomonas culicis]|eukprot:EPY30026.1 hypothetical protein STCU_04273 [Strigomonas culicis]
MEGKENQKVSLLRLDQQAPRVLPYGQGTNVHPRVALPKRLDRVAVGVSQHERKDGVVAAGARAADGEHARQRGRVVEQPAELLRLHLHASSDAQLAQVRPAESGALRGRDDKTRGRVLRRRVRQVPHRGQRLDGGRVGLRLLFRLLDQRAKGLDVRLVVFPQLAPEIVGRACVSLLPRHDLGHHARRAGAALVHVAQHELYAARQVEGHVLDPRLAHVNAGRELRHGDALRCLHSLQHCLHLLRRETAVRAGAVDGRENIEAAPDLALRDAVRDLRNAVDELLVRVLTRKEGVNARHDTGRHRGGGAQARLGHVAHQGQVLRQLPQIGGVHRHILRLQVVPLAVEVIVGQQLQRHVVREGGARRTRGGDAVQRGVVQERGRRALLLRDAHLRFVGVALEHKCFAELGRQDGQLCRALGRGRAGDDASRKARAHAYRDAHIGCLDNQIAAQYKNLSWRGSLHLVMSITV